jgi:hypothetical protein
MTATPTNLEHPRDQFYDPDECDTVHDLARIVRKPHGEEEC